MIPYIPRFQVLSASACMPANCWGRYAKIAVVELDPATFTGRVKMISERARGVRQIITIWDRLNVGKTSRCAYRRALQEANALAARLNAEVTA